MKVLLVNGSPKANGNTARALAEVAEQLNVEGIDTESFKVKLKVNMFGRETPAEVDIAQVELP